MGKSIERGDRETACQEANLGKTIIRKTHCFHQNLSEMFSLCSHSSHGCNDDEWGDDCSKDPAHQGRTYLKATDLKLFWSIWFWPSCCQKREIEFVTLTRIPMKSWSRILTLWPRPWRACRRLPLSSSATSRLVNVLLGRMAILFSEQCWHILHIYCERCWHILHFC